MSWIDELFGGGRAQAGGDMYNQMQQGMGQSQGLLNPYINRGNTAYDAYITALNQAKDPAALYNQFAAGYKESPEALAMNKVGQQGANNAAAASGMLGSGAEQTAAANLSQSVRANDFDKYMQNIFGLRTQYLGGQGGLESQGFQAANNLSQQEQKYYEDMAKAKAAQDEGQSQGLTGLIGTGLGLAGDIFGGGLFGGAGRLFGGGGQSSPWLDPDTNQFYQQQS